LKKVIILLVLITIAITIEFSSVSCQGEGGMSLAETEKLKQDSSSNASESMTSEILKPPEGWPLPFNEGIFINSSDTRIIGSDKDIFVPELSF